MENRKAALRLLAQQEIEEILATKYTAESIANSYIAGKCRIPRFWCGSIRKAIKNAKKRLDKKTLVTLNANYGKESVEEILFALSYFEDFHDRKPDFDIWEKSNNRRESFSHFSKRHEKMIKDCAVFLEDRFLRSTEKKVIAEIKVRHEEYLKSCRQTKARRKEKSLDPLQEIEITNRLFIGPVIKVRNAMFTPQGEEWAKAYKDELGNYTFKRPRGKPKKKTAVNALLIVIYKILARERCGLQIKAVQSLVADIASQHLNKQITVKIVDNAIHDHQ